MKSTAQRRGHGWRDVSADNSHDNCCAILSIPALVPCALQLGGREGGGTGSSLTNVDPTSTDILAVLQLQGTGLKAMSSLAGPEFRLSESDTIVWLSADGETFIKD